MSDRPVSGRLDLHLSAMTSAEKLTTEARAQLEGAFGVPVANLFGSTGAWSA